eukprot:UN04106
MIVIGAAMHGASLIILLALIWVLFIVLRMGLIVVGPKRAKFTKISDDIVQIDFSRREFGRYEAGQYVFMCIPNVSIFEFHPFSIATSGVRIKGRDAVTIYVRSMGNWTEKLCKIIDRP